MIPHGIGMASLYNFDHVQLSESNEFAAEKPIIDELIINEYSVEESLTKLP